MDRDLMALIREALTHIRADAFAFRDWADNAVGLSDDAGAYKPQLLTIARQRNEWAAAIETLIYGDNGPAVATVGSVEPSRAPTFMGFPGEIRFRYRNWRSEITERHARPVTAWFGCTEWHRDPQWLLRAHDLDKDALRDFAMRDMIDVRDAAP